MKERMLNHELQNVKICMKYRMLNYEGRSTECYGIFINQTAKNGMLQNLYKPENTPKKSKNIYAEREEDVIFQSKYIWSKDFVH